MKFWRAGLSPALFPGWCTCLPLMHSPGAGGFLGCGCSWKALLLVHLLVNPQLSPTFPPMPDWISTEICLSPISFLLRQAFGKCVGGDKSMRGNEDWWFPGGRGVGVACGNVEKLFNGEACTLKWWKYFGTRRVGWWHCECTKCYWIVHFNMINGI